MRRVPVEPVLLDRFDSNGVTIHHPSSGPQSLLRTTGPASLVVAELEPGAVLGRHPAVGAQLLVVVAGAVRVAGEDGAWTELTAGEAVQVADGEQHETRSEVAAILAIMEWTPAPAPP